MNIGGSRQILCTNSFVDLTVGIYTSQGLQFLFGTVGEILVGVSGRNLTVSTKILCAVLTELSIF